MRGLHFATANPVVVDGSPVNHGMIKFDNLTQSRGGGAGIPDGAIITAAMLSITTGPARRRMIRARAARSCIGCWWIGMSFDVEQPGGRRDSGEQRCGSDGDAEFFGCRGEF